MRNDPGTKIGLEDDYVMSDVIGQHAHMPINKCTHKLVKNLVSYGKNILILRKTIIKRI